MQGIINDVVTSANYSIVIEAAKSAYEEAEEMGLPSASIADIERVIVTSHNVAPDPSAGRYLGLIQMDHAATKHILNIKSSSKYFTDVFFTEAHGYNVSVTGPTDDFVQQDEEWWVTAWEKGISIGDTEYDDFSEIWEYSIAVRIDDEAGNPVGVMRAMLDLTAIQDIADLKKDKVESGQVLIFTHNGLPIAETASDHDPTRIMSLDAMRSDNVKWTKIGEVINSSTSSGSELTEDSMMMMGFARSTSDGLNWGVIVEQPQDVAFAFLSGLNDLEDDLSNSQKTMGITILAVAMGMALIGIIIAFSVSRSITGPIDRLRSATEQFRMGNEDIVIDIDSKDEIGDLAVAFDRMLSERKLANEALRTERDYSTGIVERTPAVIVGIAPDSSVTFINPAGEEITGYSAEELIDKNWWQTFHPGDEYQQVEELFRILREEGDVHNYEMTLTAKNKEKRACEWNAIKRYDDRGEIVEIIAFGNDITERKQSEADLRKANEEINLIGLSP